MSIFRANMVSHFVGGDEMIRLFVSFFLVHTKLKNCFVRLTHNPGKQEVYSLLMVPVVPRFQCK